jgi:prepilin-type N-terminal cleavage/methylation domain-containing protein
MKDRGFSLVELLVVLAIIALLVSLLFPSLDRAKAQARLVVCQCNTSAISKGLVLYTCDNAQQLPPFAFLNPARPDLPLSGHWGGIARPDDPNGFGRVGVSDINLWALVAPGFAAPGSLVCPASGLGDSQAQSPFPYEERFSTYCLRFPESEDIFANSPGLAYKTGMLLGVYRWAGGGQRVRVGQGYQQVPLLRMDKTYRLPDGGLFDPASGAMLADAFWALGSDAVAMPTASHGLAYNILQGDGAVKTALDNGTIAENSAAPGQTSPFGLRSEIIWQYFEDAS